jgi:predicted transcriptional regulator of viral defense system
MMCVLTELLGRQQGVLSRAQALAAGLTRAGIAHRLARRRWQRIVPGVYAAFTGPVTRCALLWAVVLRAGPGAVVSHETAAELQGLIDPAGAVVHVSVPGTRHPRRIAGVVVHRCDRLAERRHPVRLPPQTRVEDTVLDLVDSCADVDDAMAWLARAVASRVTSAPRLVAAARTRGRLRHRSLLGAALGDVDSG